MSSPLDQYSIEELYAEICRRSGELSYSLPEVHKPNQILFIDYDRATVTWTSALGYKYSSMPLCLVTKNCPYLKDEIRKIILAKFGHFPNYLRFD